MSLNLQMFVQKQCDILKIYVKECRDSPRVKTMSPKAEGVGLIPGWEARTPRASQPKNQNIKQKQCCSKFNEDFKNGPHPKKKNLKKKTYV